MSAASVNVTGAIFGAITGVEPLHRNSFIPVAGNTSSVALTVGCGVAMLVIGGRRGLDGLPTSQLSVDGPCPANNCGSEGMEIENESLTSAGGILAGASDDENTPNSSAYA
jgi:hypothetical protein